MRLLLALLKKWLGVRSPSKINRGFEFEYDFIKAEKRANRKTTRIYREYKDYE